MTRTLARLRALIPALLLALPLVVASGQDAQACSCEPRTAVEAIRRVPYIFDSRVVEMGRALATNDRREGVAAVVEVTERWNG